MQLSGTVQQAPTAPLTGGKRMTRLRTLLVLVVTIATVAVGLVAAPASAGQFPAGCRVQAGTTINAAVNYDWRNNCFLGRNGTTFDNNAWMVVGTQRILRGSGFFPGPSNDGLFGSQTEAAVVAYRNAMLNGSNPGNIVNDVMWQHMLDQKLVAREDIFLFGQLARTFVVRGSESRSFAARCDQGSCDAVTWYVRNLGNSDWVVMSLGDVR